MFSIASILGVAGGWAVKALLKVGVKESTAGAFAASRVFGPLVAILFGAGVVFAGWVVLKIHDNRIRSAATATAQRVCDADKAAMREASLLAQIKAKDEALSQKQKAINDRDGAIAAFEKANEEFADANTKLRELLDRKGARRVLEPDDPWLRPVPKGSAGAAARGAGR